jgi:hypothetical protein
MCLFQEYEASVRMNIVKRFYDAVSLFKISLPTPIMAGVRTPTRQFSSCSCCHITCLHVFVLSLSGFRHIHVSHYMSSRFCT